MIVKILEGRLISNNEGRFIPLYFQIPDQTSSLGPLLLIQKKTAVSNPRPSRHLAYDRARLFHYFGQISEAQAEAQKFRQENPDHYDAKHLDELLAIKSGLQEKIEITTIKTTPGYCQCAVFGQKNLIPKLREFDPALFRDTSPTEQHRLSYEETAEVEDQLINTLNLQQQGNDIIGEIRNQLFYEFMLKKTELIDSSVEQEEKDPRLTQLKRLRTSHIDWIEKIITGNKTEKQLKKALSKRCAELGLSELLNSPIQPIIEAIQQLSGIETQILDTAGKYDIRMESKWHENLTLWKYSQNGINLRKYNFTETED